MDIQTIEQDLKDAMRSRDETRKRTLRMVIAAVKMAQIEKQSPLDEAGLLTILQKEIKSRRESILEAQRARRDDLASATEAEIAVLETYLPKQLTSEELDIMVKDAIVEAGAILPSDMGKVMKLLVPRLQGRAPGDQVSQLVRQHLQKA